MNRQPYCRPPKFWAPCLTPWIVRWTRGRRRKLLKRQQVETVDVQGWDQVQSRWQAGDGVMIVPNHSAHYDSTALYIAADRAQMPLQFMTAWQVFGMAKWWEQMLMQRVGCFSIDRESNDRQSFKQAVEILQQGPVPLVIFPEGDIYHTTDFVTPFREGAAAIASSAAKRADRAIWVVPCGIKFWYEDDPRPGILEALAAMEESLHLRPQPQLSLPARIHRLAEAALALKELDYTGHTFSGSVRMRIERLTTMVLDTVESRHSLSNSHRSIPEQVKQLRQTLIALLDGSPEDLRDGLERDMEDLFFAMQLYSYRGDYLDDNPSIERVAETVDKLEEDILDQPLPKVRGRRKVKIQMGEAREIPPARGREAISELTSWMQNQVQELVDRLDQRGP